MYGSIGTMAISEIELTTNQAILGIVPDEKRLLPKYLYYYLQFHKKELIGKGRGGTQQNLNANMMKEYPISYPSLPEQKRIVMLLEKAEKLKGFRADADKLTDELLKSVFYEMFGDPIKNGKKWGKKQIGDITESRLGKMLDAKKQTGKNKCKYLRNTNVKWNHFDFTELLEMDFDSDERIELTLKKGDLLICEGGEVGRCAIWNNELPDCYFQKALHRVRCQTDKILPEYLLRVFWRYSDYNGFRDIVHSSTITHLTGVVLRKIEVPLPPISHQKKFAELVRIIEELENKQVSSKQSIDDLFNALMQKAFRGELIA